MMAETIPGAYDVEGKKVFRPFDRRKGLKPTFPLGRYVSHPLSVHCKSVDEVRLFLNKCKYVSDRDLFGKEDFWQPPEDFEKRKEGDCEDFAFWTWRQFMDLGYNCRIVFGRHGRYGYGHAWVQFVQNGNCFIVEPLVHFLGVKFPRLSTLRYHPRFSVSWDGDKLSYFSHHENPIPSFSCLLRFLPEYLATWAWAWFVRLPQLPMLAWYLLKRLIEDIRWTRREVKD